MKRYQRQAVKLASEIMRDLNKPIYRMCPGCGKPTNDLVNDNGDKYGHVYHTKCFKEVKPC